MSRSFIIYTFYASAATGKFSRFSYFSTPPSSSGPTSHSHGQLIVSNPIHSHDHIVIESPQLTKNTQHHSLYWGPLFLYFHAHGVVCFVFFIIKPGKVISFFLFSQSSSFDSVLDSQLLKTNNVLIAKKETQKRLFTCRYPGTPCMLKFRNEHTAQVDSTNGTLLLIQVTLPVHQSAKQFQTNKSVNTAVERHLSVAG